MKKNPLFALFITVLIDMLGVGIIIPILAPLLSETDSSILPAELSQSFRNIIYGIVVAIYPIAQFFGSPILGTLSDHYGRKKILIISLIGTFFGYLFTAFGILYGNIWLIVVGRLIDGITGGNISVANSSIADMSDNQNKAKNFGMIGAAFGIGFIIGPLVGGFLSDPKIITWFSPSVPYFFTSILTLANILLLKINFSETLKYKKISSPTITKGFENIIKAFRNSDIEQLFVVLFLTTIGFTFFTQVFQLFLLKEYNVSESQIGLLNSYAGFWIVFTQGFLVNKLSKNIDIKIILKRTLLFLSIVMFFLILPNRYYQYFFIIPFVAVFNGILNPFLTTLISNSGGEEMQGEIMGITQSIRSVAISITPIIGSILFNVYDHLPMLIGSLLIFISWIIFSKFIKDLSFD